MARARREEYKGGYYHVIARGNNREYIFRKDLDKRYFLKLIYEGMQPMGYRLLGYVLMDNHYHLLIQVMDVKLQKIMHQINNKYSKYFNAVYERCGHVFQGRYKASPIREERYLIKVLAYIHQNPVKAGMCSRVDEYKWSSDKFYRRKSNGFIETRIINDMIERGFDGCDNKYSEIMDEVDGTVYEKLNEIGEIASEIMMKSSVSTTVRPSLNEILEDAVGDETIANMIMQGTRKSRYKEFKIKYVEEAQKYGYTLREIGSNIGQSGNSIWKLLQKQ